MIADNTWIELTRGLKAAAFASGSDEAAADTTPDLADTTPDLAESDEAARALSRMTDGGASMMGEERYQRTPEQEALQAIGSVEGQLKRLRYLVDMSDSADVQTIIRHGVPALSAALGSVADRLDRRTEGR